MLLHEIVVLPEGKLEISFQSPSSYGLRFGDLVEYANGVRRIRGRRLPYAFRSIEQLRYDFERDGQKAA
jgi:hypothetical protein